MKESVILEKSVLIKFLLEMKCRKGIVNMSEQIIKEKLDWYDEERLLRISVSVYACVCEKYFLIVNKCLIA